MIWFLGVIKFTNMFPLASPDATTSLEALFSRKHCKEDDTVSDICVVNEYFESLINFYVALALDPSAAYKAQN